MHKKQHDQLIKVAIIDDGVNEGLYGRAVLENNIQIDKNKNIFHRKKYDKYKISHGTICTEIMQQYSKCRVFNSIKILNDREKATKQQLIKAIEWCINNKVNLINLSIGTIDYRDFDDVKKIVNIAYSKGIVIVAALSNKGVITYPASLTNTIGVKCDRENKLSACEYTYNLLPLDQIEVIANSKHKLVDIFENDIITPIANSFAAPVCSALIYNIMCENPKLKVEELKEYLYKKVNKNIDEKLRVNNYYRNVDWISKAIIFIIDGDGKLDINKKINFNIYDILYINYDKKNDPIKKIIDYMDRVIDDIKDVDTVIIVDKKSKILLNDEIDFFMKIGGYSKNVVYIDDGINIRDFSNIKWNKQTKVWGPFFNEQKLISCNEIELPVIAVYDLNMKNEISYDLSKIFEEDGYCVLSTSNAAEDVLFNLEFVRLNQDRNYNLSLIYTLSMIKNSDIVICRINIESEEKLVEIAQTKFADISIMFVDDYLGYSDLFDDLQNYCDKLIVLSQKDKNTDINDKIKIINFKGRETIVYLYNYLKILMS